jgi:hypothetical protein
MMDDTTNLPTSIDTSDKAAHPRPSSRRSDGSQTPRWRKADSNSQSRVASRYRQVMPWIVDRRHYVPKRRRCSSTIAPS